ncbi:MAG: SWIM zinc finger family protein [Pseudomonadota bacterium]
MSVLAAAYAAFDDAALAALTSKGLVRRARWDMEAGNAVAAAPCGETVEIVADGETVTLDPGGPRKARCTCPASGVCRHILIAVMALRAETAGLGPAEEPEPTDAAAEIAALDEERLRRFAASDFPAAARLSDQPDILVEAAGPTTTVHLHGAPLPVVFIAGLGLEGAVFKGPARRRRLFATAAAMVLMRRAGRAIESTAEDQGKAFVSTALLDAAEGALERAALGIAAGGAALAAEGLLDVAISARADAAPRLASELRALSRKLPLLTDRHVDAAPEAVMAQASRSAALLAALRRRPNDPDLTGTLRRSYSTVPESTFWVLGARAWQTPAGARGLSVHLYDPRERRWLTTGPARAAGQDPSFSASSAYRGGLWSVGRIDALMARAVHLVRPRVSSDGRVADDPNGDNRQTNGATAANAVQCGPIASLDALEEAGALTDRWIVARGEIARRLGAGLGRATRPQAFILAPVRTGPLRLDEHAQRYRLALIDERGDRLDVSLAVDAAETVRRLIRADTHRTALLVEILPGVREHSGAPFIEPVAALRDGPEGIEVSNFAFDQRRLRRWLELTRRDEQRAPRAAAEPTPLPADPILELSTASLDAACQSLRHSLPFDPAPLVRRARDLSLTTLADALASSGRRRDPAAALTLAYVANEALVCRWAALAEAADGT